LLRDDSFIKTLTQQELVDILEIRQLVISKKESQDDIMVGTLERYIKALGSKLEIRAKFPDKVVMLTQFIEGKRSESLVR
jgi:GTPase Era involved in 16S rRNA processing